MQSARNSSLRPELTALFWLLVAGCLAALGMFFNIVSLTPKKPSKRTRVSSLFLTLSKLRR